MYLLRQRFELARLGAYQEYINHEEAWLAFQKELPGFRGKFLCQSLSHPLTRIGLMLWESREAQLANRDRQLAFGRDHMMPPTIATLAAPPDVWEMVLEVPGPHAGARPGFIGTAVWQLWGGEEEPAAFIRSRQTIGETLAKTESFIHLRLFRSPGDPRRYFVMQSYTSREALVQESRHPDVLVALAAGRGGAAYTTIPPVYEGVEPLLVG